jgi:hypothetical protein
MLPAAFAVVLLRLSVVAAASAARTVLLGRA